MTEALANLQKKIRTAQRHVAKGKKSGLLDATHYAWQAELDRLNRELYALKSKKAAA